LQHPFDFHIEEMIMKRPLDRLTISVLVLVLMGSGLVVLDGIATHATINAKTSGLKARGPSLTIIFRGLMALRQDHEEHTLAVGILRAPEHEFTMQVLEKSPQGISTYSIPMNQLMGSKSDTLVVEAPAQRAGVTYYQNGVFDRTKGLGDIRDFRWLIDLEGKEFYGRKLAIDQHHMGVEVKFSNGEFYTKSTTRPLQRKVGAKAFEYFGRVAQEIATDVFLEDGDFVLTSQVSGTEILRLKQKPDTTYELVFDNNPPPMQHPAMGPNHFQYYYGFFPMPKSQWYEFRVVSPALAQTGLKGRNLYLVEFADPPRSDEIPCLPVGSGGGGG
jgi:hypothetical protein